MNHIEMYWIIYANLDRLMSLLEPDDYLFHNYKWVQHDTANTNRVSCSFPEDQGDEARAVFHELWKLKTLSVTRNWN